MEPISAVLVLFQSERSDTGSAPMPMSAWLQHAAADQAKALCESSLGRQAERKLQALIMSEKVKKQEIMQRRDSPKEKGGGEEPQ